MEQMTLNMPLPDVVADAVLNHQQETALIRKHEAMLLGWAFTCVTPGDRKQVKDKVLVRMMAWEEVQALVQGQTYEYISEYVPGDPRKESGARFGVLRRCKVSSIKWRGRGEARGIESIKFKYGLKQYWDWTPHEARENLVVRL